MFLFKKAKVLFTSLQTESTCLSKLSFESMMTPKYLHFEVDGHTVYMNDRLYFSMISEVLHICLG